ncbi:MAG: hypothetical protein KDE50_06500, partial [Caldilineaceae bacterium]|nr:hypothetical protein [Caldilineaceae bacterium]
MSANHLALCISTAVTAALAAAVVLFTLATNFFKTLQQYNLGSTRTQGVDKINPSLALPWPLR